MPAASQGKAQDDTAQFFDIGNADEEQEEQS